MIKILFICHGNICRSVMGQYILQDMVNRADLSEKFEIDSAAVSREEIGNPIYGPARRELMKRGVPVGEHRARQVTMEDYRQFDRIYYMDRSNRNYLARLLPPDSEKIRPLYLMMWRIPGIPGTLRRHIQTFWRVAGTY